MTQVAGTADWLVASAAEGVARAYAVAGNHDECNRWADEAARLIELIDDEDDRKMIASQLATVRDT
jgi:hypothetical protein